ncbi:helix-turn-helix domain-containing protein, partial [Haloferax sp. AB510]|uniref:helix-turn-helix domain-containing protein n=1 Tax=Haloferax sp. AB510 TaxID=2934172 RepID=UPI00209C4AA8
MVSSDKFEAVKTTETTLRTIAALLDMESARIEELSAELDIAPSTVHRHLQTLRKHGYVINDGGSYRLGLQFL